MITRFIRNDPVSAAFWIGMAIGGLIMFGIMVK
jgi:hypothetical protein